MGFFGISKKKNVVDLGERYKKQQEKIAQLKESLVEDSSSGNIVPQETNQNSQSGMFNFFGNMANAGSNQNNSYSEDTNESINPDEKRRKLAKRLMEMTEKMESLSNQIYHLQQRIEVLERKNNINPY